MQNKEKRYISDIPDLLNEWDWELNNANNLDPRNLSHGSTKKAHWICNQGHKYIARIDHRCIMGSGCPYCAGKLPIIGTTDLATLNPELLDEWDYNKNKYSPENYTQGSNKKVWWKCKACGNEWQTQVCHRSIYKSGCPECAKKVRAETRIKTYVAKNKSLAETHPDVLSEWVYEMNHPLTPNNITGKSNKKAWWHCGICGNDYKMKICNKTIGYGCPICAGKLVVEGYNDLATKHPELLSEWHPAKNGGLKPTEIMPYGDTLVWWKCKTCGHSWKTTVYSRAHRGSGCPVCANKVIIPGKNDLATLKPALAKDWHPTKNGDLKPSKVSVGSKREVWWKCEKGHEWEAVISSRSNGCGCPECIKEMFTSFPEQTIQYYLSKVTKAENRANVHGYEVDVYLPELSAGIEYNGYFYHINRNEFDEKKQKCLSEKGIRIIRVEERKNNSIGKEEVLNDIIHYTYSKNKFENLSALIDKILQLLSLPNVDINIERDIGNIYEQYIDSVKKNSLAEKCPWLIEEWNYERNGKLTPWQVSYGSDKKVWWKCKSCGYEWLKTISSRKKSNCPKCKNIL